MSRLGYELYWHYKTHYIVYLVLAAIFVAKLVIAAIVGRDASDEIFIYFSGVVLVIWLAYAMVTIWRKWRRKI